MDESKKVKEKFDAIFNTTVYMKSLDYLSKTEKDVIESKLIYLYLLHWTFHIVDLDYLQSYLFLETKIEKERLQHLTSFKNTALNKKSALADEETKFQSATHLKEEKEQEMKTIHKRIKQVDELQKNFVEVNSSVSEMKAKIKSFEDQIEELQGNIQEEFAGDLVQLQNFIKDFKAKIKLTQQEHDSVSIQYL